MLVHQSEGSAQQISDVVAEMRVSQLGLPRLGGALLKNRLDYTDALDCFYNWANLQSFRARRQFENAFAVEAFSFHFALCLPTN